MSRKITSDEAADYLIALAHEWGEPVENLKLQKLLYYAQAWHVALYDRPLFDAKFEARVYGPTIAALDARLERFGLGSLPAPAARPELPEPVSRFLDGVAARYLPLDEWELERMTRREDPWLSARGNLPMNEPSHAEISEDEMRAYFRRLANAA